MFKSGDVVTYANPRTRSHTGALVVVDINPGRSSLSRVKVKQISSGFEFFVSEDSISPFPSFDGLLSILRPHLDTSGEHYQLTNSLKAYRSSDYLALKIDGVALYLHRSSEPSGDIMSSIIRRVSEELEACQPVELTLDEIARKFNLNVNQLRIKE